jgi:hypothetical protein
VQRETERIIKTTEGLLRIIPDSSAYLEKNHVRALLACCERYTPNSISRYDDAKKARAAASRGLANFLSRASEEKDRGEEYAHLLLLVAEVILNGGGTQAAEDALKAEHNDRSLARV